MAIPVVESFTTTLIPTNDSTPTFNMPATRPDGDLYIAILGKDDDPAYTSIPGTWNQVYHTYSGNTSGPRAGVWWWIGSSEPSSYTLASDLEEHAGVILRISGADNGSPIDKFGVATGNTNQSNQSAPNITTINDETLVLRISFVDQDKITATPATEIDSGVSSASGGVGYGVSEETGPNPAGATGTAQFTHLSDATVRATIAIKAAAGVVDVTGNLSATEAADTAAFAGDVLVASELAATDAADTAAIAGGVENAGSLAATEAVDVAAITGTVADDISGSLAATEAADTAAIAGAMTIAGLLSASESIDVAAMTGTLSDTISGSLAATEAPDTSAMVGGIEIAGSLATTEAPDTSAIAGAVTIAGLLSASEPIDVAAITGTLSGTISGSLAATEAADIAAIASGIEIAGSLATTEASDAAAMAGAVTIAGVLSPSEPIDIATITGTLSDGISGSLATTEALDAAAIAGAVTIAGVLSPSEPIDVAVIIGTLEVTGSLAATEAADMALFSFGADFQPWICQVDASRRGPIAAEGSSQKLSINVTFDPVISEAS